MRRPQWRKNGKKPENILACQLTKVRNKKEVIEEARNKGRQVHFASLMDLCHLKNTELELLYQKYKGQVVFRGDIVKNDSGSYAVFTEQGSLASQMTAAKVMDTYQGFQDVQDKQLMQYLLIPRSEWKMHRRQLLKIPKSECPDIWTRVPKHKWPKSWSSMEDPVVPLEKNLYGHPLAGLLWERQLEKVLLEHGWEKFKW